MPTDTTIIDRLRAEDAFWTPKHGYDIEAMLAIMREAADALTAAHAALAPVAPPAETGGMPSAECAGYCCGRPPSPTMSCPACFPAPPAVAGGDAPEIQVGDWVALNTRYETDSTYILSGLNRVSSEVEADNFNQRGHWYKPLPGDQPKPDVSELRGERDGQPFIWRRRQEGQ